MINMFLHPVTSSESAALACKRKAAATGTVKITSFFGSNAIITETEECSPKSPSPPAKVSKHRHSFDKSFCG